MSHSLARVRQRCFVGKLNNIVVQYGHKELPYGNPNRDFTSALTV
jgi:hypothetical protein